MVVKVGHRTVLFHFKCSESVVCFFSEFSFAAMERYHYMSSHTVSVCMLLLAAYRVVSPEISSGKFPEIYSKFLLKIQYKPSK